MPVIVALVGSTRAASYNLALAHAAVAVAPTGVRIDIAPITGIPLYDGDLEQEKGVPQAVQMLKERIAAADGLLIVTPEYNHSVPGPLKNAIDWLSRPPADIRRVFGGKRVALLGATSGPGGTRAAQLALLPVLRALGTDPWFERQLHIANAGAVFDGEGRLRDPEARERLTRFIGGFAAALRRERDLAAANALTEVATPEAVRDHARLTLAQKVRLLERWASDERDRLVAANEGMAGGDEAELGHILEVLHQLTSRPSARER